MERQKKVLFFSWPMKGHLCHTVRMAEWFLNRDSKYEVHVCSSPDVQDCLPEGVVFHANPYLPTLAESSSLFSKVSEARTPIQSLAIMMEGIDWEKQLRCEKFALTKLKELWPDVVVYEHMGADERPMHTACKHWGIPGVFLVSMARPRIGLSPGRLLGLLFSHFSTLKKTIRMMSSRAPELESIIGCKFLPGKDKPFTIYPGAQTLSEVPPKANEIYTGSLCSLAPDDSMTDSLEPTSPSTRRVLGRKFKDAPELEDWVRKKHDACTPIIYLSMGTLAKPSAELLKRIVEGLESSECAMIWALPEAHQALLPKMLSDQWYVGNFLPQVAIFKAKIVQCFVSHCGGSSTTEAISNGIPMVCLPFFGDQFEWATSISAHVKAGVQIDKHKSSAADISKAVQRVLKDESFRKNAEAAALKISRHAQMRLDSLVSKKELSLSRSGVPVAAAVIIKIMNDENPIDVLPPNLRPRQRELSLCDCCNIQYPLRSGLRPKNLRGQDFESNRSDDDPFLGA